VSTLGEEGLKESAGQEVAALLVETKVGTVKAAVFVVAGYMGIMNSLSVAVANLPIAFLALTAELAAAAPVEAAAAAAAADDELLWLLWLPTTPPTTAPMTMMTRMGTPNLIQLLNGFLPAWGVMYPDDS
jgi:hypothetical protein